MRRAFGSRVRARRRTAAHGPRLRGRRVLLHSNHGVMVCGRSVAEAFDDLYYLERAAQAQVLAAQAGPRLSLVSDATARSTKAAFEAEKAVSAQLFLDSLIREEAAAASAQPQRDGWSRMRAFVAGGLAAAAAIALVARARRL